MDKNKIKEYLEKNDFTDMEELSYKDNVMVLRFFYDFDDAELESARAYANDESEAEEKSEEWYEEYFLPYLNDLAIDNTGEIIEEAMEDLGVEAQYISYEADIENHEYCEFIAVFFNKEDDVEIEKVLDELNI